MTEQARLGGISEAENKDKEIGGDEKEAGFVDIPEDWNVETVKETADSEQKNAFTDGDWVESSDMEEGGSIQLVQLGHLGEGRFKGKPNRFVNEDFAEEEGCTILKEGELMISRMQEPILRSCLLPEFEKESIMAVDIARLRPKEDWNKQFLKYLFNSRPVWKQGLAWASGTTRKRISRSNLGKVELQKPKISEQRRIASVLYNVDQAIQKTEEIIEQTQRVKKGLMQDLFTEGYHDHEEFEDSPTGTYLSDWKKVRAGNYLDLSNGEFLKSDKRNEDSDYPVYGGNGILGYADDYTVESKTILIGRVGAYCGNVQKTDSRAWVTDNAIVVDEEDDYDSEFLAYLLSNLNLGSFSEQSAQSRISQATIENLRIPLPNKDEQKKIASAINEVENKISAERSHKEQLQRLKKGLMQDLLTGRVRTSEDVEVLDEVVEVES